MKKLIDTLSIEDWKKIVYCIQRLELSSFPSSEGFNQNLAILKKLLSQLDISLYEGEKEPKTKDEVGLASLLTSIYKTDVRMLYKVAYVYEQIYTLYDIGVDNIIYNPFNEDQKVSNYVRNCERDNKQKIRKIITDGTFSFKLHSELVEPFSYILNNDENFIIIEEGNLKNYSSDLILADVTAVLRTFNGQYPSKSEINHFDFPKISIPQQEYLIGSVICGCTQNYDKFDTQDLSCINRCTRTSSGKVYYKEYKK